MELKRLVTTSVFKIGNVIFWLFLFVIAYLRTSLLAEPVALRDIIYQSGAYFLVLWLLSPVLIFLVIRTRYLALLNFIKYHLIASLVFGLVHFLLTGLFILLLERLFRWPEHYTARSLFRHYTTDWVLLLEGAGWYIIGALILLLMHYILQLQGERNRMSSAQTDLVNSNLQVMSTQLNPHFLFNAMNNITMMVRRKENSKAVNMIAALSEMLRMAMSKHSHQLVTLKSEYDLLNKYLILEKERFKDRVEVEMIFPPEVMTVSVPRLVLQPLVENAFKHGVAESSQQSKIKVEAKRADEQLVLSVYNSGNSPVNWDINNSGSLGLPNTIHRLRQIYDSNFSFKVIEQEEGVVFEISLPILPS